MMKFATGVLTGALLLAFTASEALAAPQAFPNVFPKTVQEEISMLQRGTLAPAPLQKPKKAEAEVVDENKPVPAETSEASFDVKEYKLEAPEVKLKEKDLDTILDEGVGEKQTLESLNGMLNDLTIYSRSHGYPASAAYLPAQETADGTVTVKLIPGRIGAVKLDNHTRIKEDVAESFLHGLKDGDILRTKDLETALYNLSDASGTRAVGVLAPGENFGETEVTVRIEDGKKENTVIYAENYGSKSSGRNRIGIQHNIADVGGTGAKLRVGGLISNEDLHNFYINYEMLVGHGGTTLGLGYSRMDYQLGGSGEISELGANGVADTISLFGRHPIYHESNRSLNLNYGIDYRKLTDDLDAFGGLADSEKHSYSAYVGIDGVNRTGGLVTEYMANVRAGRLVNDSEYAKMINDQGGYTEGHFVKAEASLRAIQSLGHVTDLVWTTQGQLASRNLDGSEDFSLGGANGVRAYPAGEASGDTGILSSLELRYYTPIPGLVASTYFDIGHVKYYRDSRSGNGGATLKGYGFALSYSRPDDWFARIDYARRIGDYDGMSEDAESKGRVWFMIGKTF